MYLHIYTMQKHCREKALIFIINNVGNTETELYMFLKYLLNIVTQSQKWSKPQKIWLLASRNTTGMCWFNSKSLQVQTSSIPFATVIETYFSIDVCVSTSGWKAPLLSWPGVTWKSIRMSLRKYQSLDFLNNHDSLSCKLFLLKYKC